MKRPYICKQNKSSWSCRNCKAGSTTPLSTVQAKQFGRIHQNQTNHKVSIYVHDTCGLKCFRGR